MLTLDKAVLLDVTVAVIKNCLSDHYHEKLSTTVLIYNCASLIFESGLDYVALTDNGVQTVLRELSRFELKENYFLDADSGIILKNIKKECL